MTILPKLKLGSSLAALFLFFLPWVDISCSDKTFATQSGVQVVYGGASISEAFDEDESPTEEKESLGFSFLAAIAFACVLASVVFSWLHFKSDGARFESITQILPTVALVALLIQMMIGFPAEASIYGSMEKDAPQDELGKSIMQSVKASIEIETKPAFYFELVALGIPALLLANSFLNSRKTI